MDGAVWRAARRRRQRSENNSRTGCYRFATQLRVTVRDRTGWLEGQSAQNQASRRLANTTWDRTKRQLCNQEMGGARHPAAGPPATSVVSVGTVRVAKDHAVTAPATIGARCGRGPSRPTRRATVSGWGRAADAASAALIAISATLRCPVAAVPQSNPRTERRAQRPSLSKVVSCAKTLSTSRSDIGCLYSRLARPQFGNGQRFRTRRGGRRGDS